jgi:hypothetical protein
MKIIKKKEKPKDRLLTEIENDIQRLGRLHNVAQKIPMNLISQAFPEGHWSQRWFDVDFELPMSFPLIETFMQFMKDQLPEYELRYDNQYVWEESKKAGRFIQYSYFDKAVPESIDLQVSFRSERNGSTCVLNPIGKKTKEITLYEVVCSEDAAKEFTLQE